VVATPLQAKDVLHGRHALIHRLELRQTETFQARLHALHAPHGERANLTLLKIALGFDKHIEIAMRGGKLAEQILDILHVDDVIDQPEPGRVIPAGERRHLPRRLIRRFRPELH
ncbi:MAG: hypothetical protein ACK55I_39560, partial [bacterium]